MNRLCVSLVLAAVGASALAGGIDRAFLKDVLSVRSETGNWDELHRCAHLIGDWLTARGVYVTYETNTERRVGLYAATTPGKVHDYLFVGHFDVVKAPKEMYAPRFEGGKVFARGACDTKGNDVVMCQVLANLVGSGVSAAMFLACDEEGGGGGAGSPKMIIDRGYVPRKLILVGDTAGEEPGQLFTAEKGHVVFQLVAHGKGGHSSRPWATDNPIPKLCEGYLKFRAAWDPDADPNEHWRTVLSPTVVKASDVGNVIPDTAMMCLSCRYTSIADWHRAEKMLKATGLEVRSPAGYGRRPVENKPGDPEIAALLKAMGEKLPGGIREGKMSAATDASYYAALGIPIVIWTATGGEPHSVREWGLLSSFDDYADFFTDYLKGKDR